MPPKTIDCSDPMYWSTTYTPMTNLDLSAVTSSVNITPNTITWACNNNKEQEEYIEKLEKHIDELEEDIEYFNQQLQEKNDLTEVLETKVEELEKKTDNMDMHIAYLEGRLQALEDKINT